MKKLGIWVHHLPKEGKNAVKNLVKRLNNGGFTLILPCIKNPDGYLDYQSRIGRIRPIFKDWDPLEVLINEAEKNKIEVHPWFCVFTEGEGSALLRQKKLHAIDFKGKTSSRWACSAQEEVQDYELSLYREVMQKYPVTGVHLDYIRYDNNDFCFCPSCRKRFLRETGLSAPKTVIFKIKGRKIKEVDVKSRSWSKWVDWRVKQVSRFVAKLHNLAKKRKKEISAAVFSDYPQTLVNLGQDWINWGTEKLVDYLFPMNYTSSLTVAIEWTKIHRFLLKGKCQLWEGLGKNSPRSYLSSRLLAAQMKGCLKAGSEGIVIFSSEGLEKSDVRMLRTDFLKEVIKDKSKI